MNIRTKLTHRWQIWTSVLLFGVLLPLLGMQATARAADASTAGIEQDANTNGVDHGKPGIYGFVDWIPTTDGTAKLLTPVGTWKIGGKEYETTDATEFDPEFSESDYALGVCVKVSLVDGSTNEVRQLETRPNSDCKHSSNGGDRDRSGIYGFVQEPMPTTGGTANLPTLIGVWKISDKFYTTTEETDFDQDYGKLRPNACVKVVLTDDGATVRELETRRRFYCKGDDNHDGHGEDPGQAHGTLFAAIDSFPADPFVGDWVIGGITVTAGITTEFKQKNGDFAIGTRVKVKFILVPKDPNDPNSSPFLATEIKTAFSPSSGDHHHHHHGHHRPMDDAWAYGIIEEPLVTTPLPSIWHISGISYTVDISTELHGDFAVGQTVKVEYTREDDGSLTATEIWAMPPGAGGCQNGHYKVFGFVETPPTSGFLGGWTIGGARFTSDFTSKFAEEHGLLTRGAYVEVEYSIKNNVHRISNMATHVPPGEGEDDHAGTVEQMGDNAWRVGGRTFTVTPATEVSGNVATNRLAVVNSYTAADGSQVATRIDSVTLNSLLFLPAAMK